MSFILQVCYDYSILIPITLYILTVIVLIHLTLCICCTYLEIIHQHSGLRHTHY